MLANFRIEAACYFLQDGMASIHAEEFQAAIDELIDMIVSAQQADGYLNVYFTVVDPAGRFKNLRDMHEMYNAGHLLEGALAHYHFTGSKRFLDVMIRNVDCFMREFGSEKGKKHGYPGHPELELAVLRLYDVTKDPKHLAFAKYLLEARGVPQADQDNQTYFLYEAEQRKDPNFPTTFTSINDVAYMQAHAPIVEQTDVLGHSVRAFYLLTAAADTEGRLHDASRRLWDIGVDQKMYVTGGFGSEPRHEGFSPIPHHLPQSTGEGGCYAETCASIAAVMCSERLLAANADGKVRDVMELALLNAVLGGGSLDGKAFAYENKLATYADETAIREPWFEVCCCPPNLSRTLGMLGGYTWRSGVNAADKTIELDVYLFVSATRTIDLGGAAATVKMESGMPWVGTTTLALSAPEGWTWALRLPKPEYAENMRCSKATTESNGFLSAKLPSSSTVKLTFDLPVRILASHPASGDTLTVTRGPIVYVAESVDNEALDNANPHFEGVGLGVDAKFDEENIEIQGVPVVALSTDGVARIRGFHQAKAYKPATASRWEKVEQRLRLVPWFARANRGGKARVRTSFLRAEGV